LTVSSEPLEDFKGHAIEHHEAFSCYDILAELMLLANQSLL